MKPQELLQILNVAEKLKCNTRHCYTSSGRQESVAEHSWRLALTAMLIENEFPEADINKVIKMCIIHDLGEAFTGDVPVFLKTEKDSEKEDDVFIRWIETFSEPEHTQWLNLYKEMNEQISLESKIYKALDKLEAVIQHNESDIKTWLPLEYDLQLTHGAENVQFSEYMKSLKAEIDTVTRKKIAQEKGE